MKSCSVKVLEIDHEFDEVQVLLWKFSMQNSMQYSPEKIELKFSNNDP
jgi:S-adenosylmethionine hydrolase